MTLLEREPDLAILDQDRALAAEGRGSMLRIGDYVLDPGDTVAHDTDTMGHVMRDEGSEPLVLIASVLFGDGQPGFIFEEATPTSETETSNERQHAPGNIPRRVRCLAPVNGSFPS